MNIYEGGGLQGVLNPLPPRRTHPGTQCSPARSTLGNSVTVKVMPPSQAQVCRVNCCHNPNSTPRETRAC